MNVPAFPPSVLSFSTIFEILRMLGSGLVRSLAYAACNTESNTLWVPQDNPQLRRLQLHSAVDHLTRPVPVLENILGEPYIARVNRADPAILAEVLEDYGLSIADVESWRALYTATTPTPTATS